MVIGIEAERANNPQKTGVEHYAKQLILHLAKIDRENQYWLYLRTQPEPWLKELPANFHLKVIPFPVFWTQIRISLEMLWHPVDVLFIPASALPLIHPKHSVVAIHDLAWKFFPDSFTWFMRNFLQWSTGFAVKRASAIIAVSNNTKKDLEKFYKIGAHKVKVVYHGYEKFNNLPNWPAENRIKLAQKYVVFLSTLQPRKNLEGLIDAFKRLKIEHPELPQKLVVVGRRGWMFGGILDKMQESKELVVYLDHVSDLDRLKILSGADLLVLPSLYEGFGMQILESFAANVPVAVSNTSSMPEVAGEAAIYFDPKNSQEIGSAIKSVLMDKSLADTLREKGKARLSQFSWEKCAKETLAILMAN